jgi:hypothetical protein
VNGIPHEVELQVDEVRDSHDAEVTVTVRNLGGLVRRGARFHQVSDSADPIDLELTHIVRYHWTVDEIPAAHTALITLHGPGAAALRSAAGADWQSIEGRNPTDWTV